MRKLLVLLGLLLGVSDAFAQATVEQCVRATPTGPCQAVNSANPLPVTNAGSGGTIDANIAEINGAAPSAANPLWVAPASGITGFPVTAAPRSAITTAGCTVGVASALCVAASTANLWIQVQNTHATNSIACSWGGTAVLNAAGAFMLAPGQSASWGLNASGVPTNALNCIASAAATPLYVEFR